MLKKKKPHLSHLSVQYLKIQEKMGEKYSMKNAFKIHKSLLSFTCTWPNENETILYKMIKYVWGFLVFIYISLLFMDAFVNINNISKLISDLELAVPISAYFFKFLAFVYNGNYFIKMMKLLNDDIFVTDHVVFKKQIVSTIKKSQILTTTFLIIVIVFLIMYATSPALTGTNYPSPLSTDFGAFTPLIYFIQVAGIIQGASNNVSLDCLCIALLMLGECQFDILKDKIINVRQYAIDDIKVKRSANYKNTDELIYFDDEIDQNVEERLKNVIKHHNALIK